MSQAMDGWMRIGGSLTEESLRALERKESIFAAHLPDSAVVRPTVRIVKNAVARLTEPRPDVPRDLAVLYEILIPPGIESLVGLARTLKSTEIFERDSLQIQVEWEVGESDACQYSLCSGLSSGSVDCNCGVQACASGHGTTPTPDLSRCQSYLKPTSMGGIGGSVAHGVSGGRGGGVRLVDVEYGWSRHEDLKNILQHGSMSHVRDKRKAHGTAVLGILAACGDNGLGMRGLCDEAEIHFIAASISGIRNVESAMFAVLSSAASVPTVLLLEMQARLALEQGGKRCCSPLLPAEVVDSVKTLTKKLTQAGVIVVAVAGNGDFDLDQLGRWNQDDSGAILVGSACPACPGRRKTSNHGTRVDVHSWGRSVATCGADLPAYRDLFLVSGESDRCYTGNFLGTSSAAALVAGGIGSLLGMVVAEGRVPLNSRTMRLFIRRSSVPINDVGVRFSIEAVRDELRKSNLLS